LICFRCGQLYRVEDGYAGVFLSRGRTSLEQLRHGRGLQVCDECAEGLQAWLGIPPTFPATPSADIPTRPFSAC
jgi:hypothetical protein